MLISRLVITLITVSVIGCASSAPSEAPPKPSASSEPDPAASSKSEEELNREYMKRYGTPQDNAEMEETYRKRDQDLAEVKRKQDATEADLKEIRAQQHARILALKRNLELTDRQTHTLENLTDAELKEFVEVLKAGGDVHLLLDRLTR